MGSDTFDTIRSRIEDQLAKLLVRAGDSFEYSRKVIHEPIWGTNSFYPWEVALLDTPLLQRLRLIKQTGLAYLTYPSANHTRFEHTLGVVSAASKIFSSLRDRKQLTFLENSKHGEDSSEANDRKTFHLYYAVRLAALLHDCGHSLLSHAGERVYSSLEPLVSVEKDFQDHYNVTSKGSEIFSFFIITSEAMRNFLKSIRWQDSDCEVPVSNRDVTGLLDSAAAYVIGKSNSASDYFCTNIINGPHDADKLDYIRRDAYFAGLPISYDWDRFFYLMKVKLVNIDDDVDPAVMSFEKVHHLVMPLRGISVLEQIVLCKYMLYSYLYHHQKIRASELFAERVIGLHAKKLNLEACDFLRFTDCTLSTWAEEDNRIGDILKRNLLYRSVYFNQKVLSKYYNKTDKKKKGLQMNKLMQLLQAEEGSKKIHKQLEDEIFNEVVHLCKQRGKSEPLKDEVILDVPKRLKGSIEEFKKIFIEQDTENVKRITEFFKLDNWEQSYFDAKWRGHVFCRREYVDIVCESFASAIEKVFKVEVGSDRSFKILNAKRVKAGIAQDDLDLRTT